MPPNFYTPVNSPERVSTLEAASRDAYESYEVPVGNETSAGNSQRVGESKRVGEGVLNLSGHNREGIVPTPETEQPPADEYTAGPKVMELRAGARRSQGRDTHLKEAA